MRPHRRKDSLPPRVKPVLKLLLDGLSEKEAARKTGLAPSTVHQYVKIIYKRMNVHSRAELLAHWLRKRGDEDALK